MFIWLLAVTMPCLFYQDIEYGSGAGGESVYGETFEGQQTSGSVDYCKRF